ncbi:hypothetical protein AHAS_Ahas11G0108600 [Arachis hypogaea]
MDLYELCLDENKLNGFIPKSLTSLQQLKFLNVFNKNLSKNLPPFSTKTIVITTNMLIITSTMSNVKLTEKNKTKLKLC